MLSKKQTNMFWKLFAKAAAEAVPNGSKKEVEFYRHQLINSAAGKTSIKDLDNRDFEKVMTALAVDALDYESAAYWSQANGRRFYEMVKQCARQIGEITGRILDSNYYREMFHRQFIAWEDIPEDDIFSVFQMLDTHRRRLLRKAGWGIRESGLPLSFYLPRIYIRSDDKNIDYYDPSSAANCR